MSTRGICRVTRQGIGFSVVAVATTLTGLLFQWEEFLLVGLVLVGVILLSYAFVAYRPVSTLAIREQLVTATRLSDSSLTIEVDSPRKRGLFIECGRGPFPFRFVPVARKRGMRVIRIHLDSQSRCDVESGPFRLVVSDVFGFFIRPIASSESTRIVIQPRVFDITGHITSRSRGEENEGKATGWGSQLSELVTEYNLGDEPRRIHWRTSAKVGKLMVRKELTPERNDIMLCLDTDTNSYRISSAFSITHQTFNFEDFHELCVSLALAEAKAGKGVRVVTTGSDSVFDVRHGMAAPFLRHMASTKLVSSRQVHGENIHRLARQFRPQQIFFVTAVPSQETLNILSELGRSARVTVIGCNMIPDTKSVHLDSRSITLDS